MSNLTRTADYLTDNLEKMGFWIMSERSGAGLPLVAFRFRTEEEGGDDSRHFDEFALAHRLRARGWVVPAYTMAPNSHVKMLRIVVREDFTKSRCDSLIHDIKLCWGLLEATDRETIKKSEDYIKQHLMLMGKTHTAHPAYAVSFPLIPPVLMRDIY